MTENKEINSKNLGLELSDEEGAVKEKVSSSIPGDIDPLEYEIQQMESRMNALREELKKKKKLDPSTNSQRKFTKLTMPQTCNMVKSRSITTTEKRELMDKINASRSEIHTGETDSEDEEDNQNPFESKYSSLGKDIKKRIALDNSDGQRTLQKQVNVIENKPPQAKSWKEIKGSLISLKNGAVRDEDTNVSVDQYSGIRIINPLISHSSLNDMMDGRRMIRMSTIMLHVRGGEIEGDWVTMGVVVFKSNPKTSQKGSQYSIWQLSDLKDCTKSVSMFLFGSSYKNLWKTSIGTVIGILNPQIMKDRGNEKSDSLLTLSVNNHQKVLIMGTSKDLGWCKGKTKQNNQCQQHVNKNVCEFCVYHIQREYKKTCAKRQDVQSSFSRVDPTAGLKNKVLGKGQVFYGGKLFSAPEPTAKVAPKKLAKANKSQDLSTLSSLKLKMKADELKTEDKKHSFILKHLSEGEISAVKDAVKSNDSLSDRLLMPTVGARNLLRHKTQEDHKKLEDTGIAVNVSAKELLKITQQKLTNHNSNIIRKSSVPLDISPSLLKGKSKLSTAFSSPMLGRGLKPGQEFEFDISSPPKPKDIAKAKAAAIIRSKGGVKPTNKNFISSREKQTDPVFQNKVNKRLLDTSTDSIDESPKSKRAHTEQKSTSSLSKSKLGNIDINSEEFKEMMNKRSSNSHLVSAVEDQAFENYCNGLEKKEMLEEKMASIMEIKTTAVICLKCKYIEQSASNLCKEENHPLKTVDAKKRFFECRKCKRRTTTLQKFPAKSCGNCGESSWSRCAMGKEKKGPKLDSEILSLRGDELKSYNGTGEKVYLHI